MISRADIEERVREWGLREDVVEKDFVIGWLLWGIGNDASVRDAWVFKGGTCLKKCYLETYRFSEDLDFTVVPGGPVRPEDVEPVLRRILQNASDASGIDFAQRAPVFKPDASGMYTEGRVYYVGPRRAPGVASVRLDLTASEQLVRPSVVRPISHSYPDAPAEPGTVRCYSFAEVFAEKIRAMGERGRPRDLYDIVNLFRHEDTGVSAAEVRTVLLEKCRTKGVPVPTLAAVLNAEHRTELESEWGSMLGHQLPTLPPLSSFLEELPALFAWLEGAAATGPTLQRLAVADDEDATWSAPPTVRTWGAPVPLETVRFAAANRLCVELGYKGSRRLIEPYSLRRTRDGNLILHAVRVDNNEGRSYRVDRIESTRVTDRPFIPRYLVEFSASGPLVAPPGYTEPPSRARPAARSSGKNFSIACPMCGKKFRRSRSTDTRLNEHKTPDGYRCAGSGRLGYPV